MNKACRRFRAFLSSLRPPGAVYFPLVLVRTWINITKYFRDGHARKCAHGRNNLKRRCCPLGMKSWRLQCPQDTGVCEINAHRDPMTL